jgi:hypothetical protein
VLTKYQRYYRNHLEERRAQARDAMRRKRESDPEAVNEKLRAWRKKNRQRVVLQRRQYEKENKEKTKQQATKHRSGSVYKESCASYRRNNPEKIAAKQAVAYAIRTGKLIKKPCEVCGSKKSQAHHTDYSKQLVVKWLCALHHKARHL